MKSKNTLLRDFQLVKLKSDTIQATEINSSIFSSLASRLIAYQLQIKKNSNELKVLAATPPESCLEEIGRLCN